MDILAIVISVVGLLSTIIIIAINYRTLKKGVKQDKIDDLQQQNNHIDGRVELKMNVMKTETKTNFSTLEAKMDLILERMEEDRESNKKSFRELLKSDILLHCQTIEEIMSNKNKSTLEKKEKDLAFYFTLLNSAYERYEALGGNSVIKTLYESTHYLHNTWKKKQLTKTNEKDKE